MKINEIIQNKRKALNLTQKQFAEKLNVSDKTVSRWELGTVYPNIDMIPKIAIILDISINELFDTPKDNSCLQTEPNQQKIRSFQVVFASMIIFYFLAIVLFLLSLGPRENITRGILIIVSLSIFVLATLAFFIKRVYFRDYYKTRKSINEYKYYDGILTGSTFFLISFVISSSLILSANNSSINLIIIFVTNAFAITVNLYILKSLGCLFDNFSKGFKISIGLVILFVLLSLLSYYSRNFNIMIVAFISLCLLYINMVMTYKTNLKVICKKK